MHPPRWTLAILHRLLPTRTRDAVLDDLEGLWRARCATKGRRAADRWYRRQALAAVRPALAARSAERMGSAAGGFRQDARFALNQLRRHPGVGVLVVVTLALGTGATTAVFSAVHGTLLRPLSYEDPDGLVTVTAARGARDEIRFLSAPDALDLADEVAAVADVAIFGETTVGPLTGIDRPDHVTVSWTSWNAFRLLGVGAAQGRTFAEDDVEAPGMDASATSVAVISHGLWQRAFGADSEVVGRSIQVWGNTTTVVGILPPDFRLHLPPELNVGDDIDVWVAFRGDLRDWDRDHDWLRVVARLRPEAGVEEARRGVDAYAAGLRARYARHAREETTLRVTALGDGVVAGVRGPILVLFVAVTLVLLIACGNAANLLLARGTARATEMAVRSSLGAGAGRLGRQLFTESAVLAALGAGAGALLAAGGVRLFHALRPPDLARLESATVDLPVLLFAVALGAAATVLAGVLPALQAARLGAGAGVLRSRHGSGLSNRVREALVVLQVALSVVLLGGTALLVRTFDELQSVPLGFEPDRILTVTATQTVRSVEERHAYETELVRAAREIPGVAEAGIVFPVPMNGIYERSAEYVAEDLPSDPTEWRRAYYRTASPSYFEAMGLELLRGRRFLETDENAESPVVILDERLARHAFGAADPLEQYIHVRGMAPDTIRARVIGVVEWVPQWDHRDPRPTMYFPRTFYLSHEVTLVARIEGETDRPARDLAAAVREVDPGFPSELVPMDRYVGDRLARDRFLKVVMQLFAAVALGLTAVGLHGVLSYTVRQRTRELGVRRALGARGGTLTRGVVGRAARLAVVGVALGLIGTLLLARGLEGQLFGVHPWDPVVLAATAAVVFLVVALASLAPALRAARVSPAVAMMDA